MATPDVEEARKHELDSTPRVAVVTAAASGIGRATALRLAREGFQIVAVDLSPSVTDTVAAIEAEGGVAVGRIVNCTNSAEVAGLFDEVDATLGPVEILVNGVGQPSRDGDFREFWESKEESWDFVIDVCLKSAMLCCRQVVPGMRERGHGKIVNISSVSWLVPPKTFSEYAAAKAGIVGFSRVLAVELAPFGVNVNVVSPGPIFSQQVALQPEEFKAKILATIPMGHYGQPENIAAGISFLCSEDSSFITGHNLVISGGRAML